MTIKHNSNILNLITRCLYVSSFGRHVSVNFMTIIRSIGAKIYDMQQTENLCKPQKKQCCK
jgi:hypothetical protein